MYMKQVQVEQGILNAVVIGEFDLDVAKIEFVEILDEVLQSGVTKVLIDGEQMTGKPGDFERFMYGDFVARTTLELMEELDAKLRFAYVLREPVRDPDRFGENIAVKRGMDVKVFKDTRAAIQWLNS